MRQVVSRLIEQGHQVSYYVRRDGGILVKSIDGERYPTGASGNARARQLVGSTLSEARSSQLQFATRARKVKRPSLDNEIYSEWQRVKKKWNRTFKAKESKPHPAGYFGWARIKYSIEHYGREEAMRRIREAERYATGLAYSKNIEFLAGLVKKAADDIDSQELLDLYNDIIENAYMIKEEYLKPAYDELYKLNKGYSPKEVVSNVRAILRLENLNEN